MIFKSLNNVSPKFITVITKNKLFYNMKIPDSGFMEDINKINKQDKIFLVPVTQAINFTTQSQGCAPRKNC